MKKLIFTLSFITITILSFSQKVYFVYFQTEQEQPFFVKVNEKVYSSSSSGYLILPKLLDSAYQLRIGFPQNKWPEQKFEVAVKAKDHGYLLKNFGEKGWGLFDLQNMSVQMSASGNQGVGLKTEKTEVSAFTEILARAAGDSSLREKPVVAIVEQVKLEDKPKGVISEKGTEPVLENDKTGIVVVNTKTTDKIIEENSPIAIEVKKKVEPASVIDSARNVIISPKQSDEYKKSVVKLSSESISSEGLDIVYVDEHANGSKDTIKILIPSPKPVVMQQPGMEEKKFLDISSDTASGINVVAKQNTESTIQEVRKGNDCKEIAVESDFLKLRKKMAAETDDDDMVDEARKYFKTKCFTTAQIKNLGALFLDDLGKYKFFDMAYIFVADIENFQILESELKGDYYINRFKAMLRK